jgi:hypothetical protein
VLFVSQILLQATFAFSSASVDADVCFNFLQDSR